MRSIAAVQIPQFSLTAEERDIFTTLLQCNAAFNLGVTFRVAGGWIRDRLLGKESDDLDIALDLMTGRKFETFLSQFGKANPNSGVGKSYLVQETPGVKLETVAIEIFGRKIDFINLRTESYGDSRVPEMQFGTPEVDAQRRDLTINAMFYNINTRQIEDFVGGMEDLKSMRLRTPLEPVKTFTDDPLRMLRALRFYSRYPTATLDLGLIKAMADPNVHQAYRQKVASERAGPEILKLMAGSKPSEALAVMFDSGLDKAVFDIPEVQNLVDLRMDQRNRHHAHTLLEHTLLVVKNMHALMLQENEPEEMRVKMLLAALFHDYGKAHPEIAKPKKSDPNQLTYVGHEDKSVDIAEAIMKSIAIPDDDRKFVNKVIQLHMRPHLHQGESWTNKMIGKFMRDSQIPGQESGDVWRYVMLHSIADTLSKNAEQPDHEDVAQKRQHMQMMQDYKARPGPSILKPIINGNKLMQMFPTCKATFVIDGKNFIKEISERLLEEQSAGTVVDEASAIQLVESMRMMIEQKYGPQPQNTVAWVNENCKFAQKPPKEPLDMVKKT